MNDEPMRHETIESVNSIFEGDAEWLFRHLTEVHGIDPDNLAQPRQPNSWNALAVRHRAIHDETGPSHPADGPLRQVVGSSAPDGTRSQCRHCDQPIVVERGAWVHESRAGVDDRTCGAGVRGIADPGRNSIRIPRAEPKNLRILILGPDAEPTRTMEAHNADLVLRDGGPGHVQVLKSRARYPDEVEITDQRSGLGDHAEAQQARHLGEQIDRLAQFIVDEIPGEPSRSEGAVDTAIRLLRDYSRRAETWVGGEPLDTDDTDLDKAREAFADAAEAASQSNPVKANALISIGNGYLRAWESVIQRLGPIDTKDDQ